MLGGRGNEPLLSITAATTVTKELGEHRRIGKSLSTGRPIDRRSTRLRRKLVQLSCPASSQFRPRFRCYCAHLTQPSITGRGNIQEVLALCPTGPAFTTWHHLSPVRTSIRSLTTLPSTADRSSTQRRWIVSPMGPAFAIWCHPTCGYFLCHSHFIECASV